MQMDYTRPKYRNDCLNGPRPCPFVSCKHHLYLDVSPNNGRLVVNHPGREVWELDQTCSLDIAERGGVTLEEISNLMGLEAGSIRQMEIRALGRFEANLVDQALRDPPPLRRLRWLPAVPGRHLRLRRKLELWRRRALQSRLRRHAVSPSRPGAGRSRG